jgi:hypothetical protein
VFEILYNGQQQILKICPFEYQLKYMSREVRAYNMLRERKCYLVPMILAFVFERSDDQVVGFICSRFEGEFAAPDDYDKCKLSLQQLHSYGIVHGDLNRFNIIMTADGPRFIDLENATLVIDKQDLSGQLEELEKLEKVLSDPEEWGKPRQCLKYQGVQVFQPNSKLNVHHVALVLHVRHL